MQKIKNLEILRIIGCIAVILFHLLIKPILYDIYSNIDLYNKFHNITINGYLAVDLFFILSGFFFIYTLNTNKTCWEFVKNKLQRLYPVLVFVIILYFIFSLTGSLNFTFYDNIFTLLGLNGTSLIIERTNAGHLWYVSAMFWTLLLYFYLIKNYQKKNVNLFIALTILFSYTLLLHANYKGNIGEIEKMIDSFFNAGILRALGGIGIGYFIGEWYKNNIEKINNWKANIYQVVALSGLEFVTLYFIINNLMLHKLEYNNKFIFIIAFTTIIMLFLAKKGFISKILDNDIWFKMSKYTYSIYMVHYPIYKHLKGSVWKSYPEIVYAHPILNIVFTLLLVIVAGILTYHFVEKPCTDYLKRKNLVTQTIKVK